MFNYCLTFISVKDQSNKVRIYQLLNMICQSLTSSDSKTKVMYGLTKAKSEAKYGCKVKKKAFIITCMCTLHTYFQCLR